MTPYRRRLTSDVWHFCANCTQYPVREGSYKESEDKPASGEFCNQCLSKRRRKVCITS